MLDMPNRMTSLFKGLIKDNRETAIKELLINILSENIREIQYECKESGKDTIELTDSTNSLCTTLEAVFLHGLKDSFLWQTLNVISGSDIDRRPEPNFWPILLVFLHKQVIENIQSLSQITSDIGCCRSWIRLTLNESLFSSYLNNIKKNSSALNPYYKKFAFLRDSDNVEVASKMLEGFETSIQINLPINSSLLNQWTNLTLQLAGIWSPPLKSCPIASGIDVASSITNVVTIPTPKPLQTNELFSDSIPNSPFKTSLLGTVAAAVGGNTHTTDDDSGIRIGSRSDETSDLNESENLKILLQKVDEISKISKDDDSNDDNQKKEIENESNAGTTSKFQERKNKHNEKNKAGLSLNINTSKSATITNITPVGNSVMHLSGWSIHDDGNNKNTEDIAGNMTASTPMAQSILTNSSISTVTSDSLTTTNNSSKTTTNIVSRSNSMNMSTSSLKSPLDRHSYNTLLVRHEKTRQLNWNDVWARFEGHVGVNGDIILAAASDNNFESIANEEIGEEESRQNLGFEVVPQTLSEKFTLTELQYMVEQMFQLAREKGLDSQGFVCKSCAQPLGVGFAPAQVCVFSGNYFCNSCISLEPHLIPAKIIYNWDFQKYSISKRAALFLNEFQNQPFIDLKLLNPDLYMASEEMATLQSLRIKLNFIRAYLFTCRESTIEGLQKQVWPKEYLYEHIHQYSIADLMMIQKGTLSQLLQKTVQFGEDHILNCRLCSVKGFICEICNSMKVLYPFHIETTFRCELCGAVFHANCLNDSQPCPKCERKRRREDLPLLEAVDML